MGKGGGTARLLRLFKDYHLFAADIRSLHCGDQAASAGAQHYQIAVHNFVCHIFRLLSEYGLLVLRFGCLGYLGSAYFVIRVIELKEPKQHNNSTNSSNTDYTLYLAQIFPGSDPCKIPAADHP